MEITKVNIYKKDIENSKLKGYAEVTLDDCFIVDGIKIFQNEDGKMTIKMPVKPRKTPRPNGKMEDNIAYPINKPTREMFEKAIFDKYNEI